MCIRDRVIFTCKINSIVRIGKNGIICYPCFMLYKKITEKFCNIFYRKSDAIKRFIIFQCVCSGAVYYAQLTQKKLQDTGYYEDSTPFKTTDEVVSHSYSPARCLLLAKHLFNITEL